MEFCSEIFLAVQKSVANAGSATARGCHLAFLRYHSLSHIQLALRPRRRCPLPWKWSPRRDRLKVLNAPCACMARA
jgi:hypothetical protein